MPYTKEVTYPDAEASYWSSQTFDFDAVLTNAGAVSIGCSRCTLKWKRTVPVGLSEDLMMCTLSFGKIGTGHLFTQGSSADLVILEGFLDTFWSLTKTIIHSSITLVEYAWHGVSSTSPRTEDGRGQKMGPAVRVTTKSVPGTAAVGRSPDQLACNLTMRTASRKHWGRIYLPGLDIGKWDPTYGRVLNTAVDLIATNANQLNNSVEGAGFRLGVWSQLHPGFLSCKTIEVDDVPDIQRRRRAKRRNYIAQYS